MRQNYQHFLVNLWEEQVVGFLLLFVAFLPESRFLLQCFSLEYFDYNEDVSLLQEVCNMRGHGTRDVQK